MEAVLITPYTPSNPFFFYPILSLKFRPLIPSQNIEFFTFHLFQLDYYRSIRIFSVPND